MFSPLFKGEKIRLAAPSHGDSLLFSEWSLDDSYARFLDDDPVRPEGEGRYSYFGAGSSADSYYFHLRTLDEDRLIGFVVLFNIKWPSGACELSIGIGDADYRGKGCGSEALRLVLNYAFNELNLYRVGLNVLEYNAAAIKAYERAGFVREGARRKAVQREGKRYDLVQYGILREEWQKNGA